jgi:pSer/pThr/pTyr-binding forkhead associated (FHA) protein
VVSAVEDRNDLTTTIHLTALRSVESTLSKLLEQAGPELASILAALNEDSAMLVSLIGPNKGARYLLDSEVTGIGRATENEIFLDDVTVSRKHAQVVKRDKKFDLEDLGSLNGTYLNGSITTAQVLQDGDELQIGKFRMHFFSGKVSK